METMSTVETVAHLLGVLYVVIGLSMLMRPTAYRDMVAEFFASPTLCYIGGILALLMGLVILALHDEWRGVFNIIVGVIGWLATVKGAFLIIRPNVIQKISMLLTRSEKSLRIIGLCALIFGLAIVFTLPVYAPSSLGSP
jgi:uncharacterized protein YjeT (DUF2065 family)